MRRVAVALILAAAVAVPSTADAAATYLNTSSANGAHLVKSGGTIQRLELHCSGKNTETVYGDDYAFSVRDVVELGKKGKFFYSGYAFRYGNERQPRGQVKVKLSG